MNSPPPFSVSHGRLQNPCIRVACPFPGRYVILEPCPYFEYDIACFPGQVRVSDKVPFEGPVPATQSGSEFA